MVQLDSWQDELLGKGGTYDLTGTDELSTKKFSSFVAEEGTLLAVIEGISINDATETEVDLEDLLTDDIEVGLFGNQIYRVAGYVMSKIQLVSGKVHLVLTAKQ